MAKGNTISYNFGNLIILMLAGAVSGLISFYGENIDPFLLPFVIPGLTFGIIISLAESILLGKNFSGKSFLFILISTISYFIAINIYMGFNWNSTYGEGFIIQGQVGRLFIGSFAGSVLFLLGYR